MTNEDDGAQLVADLVWAVSSPSLVTAPESVEPVPLAPGDVDVAALVEHMAKPPVRVGLYFERLVEFWLREMHPLTLEAKGLQIIDPDERRTVGELDFVLLDGDGRRQHWETAVKFYLHDVRRQGSHFPGPNATDNFEAKATKLFDQQLRRVHPTYTFAHRRAFVRGFCFYHPNTAEPTDLPSMLSERHGRGTWIHSGQFDLIERAWPSARATVAHKPHWLAPAAVPTLSMAELGETVATHFANSDRALMVTLNEGLSSPPVRICVVDDLW